MSLAINEKPEPAVQINSDTRLSVKVIANSSRTNIVGWIGNELKVKLAAPAENGKANIALLKLLSKALGLPRASIKILSGHTNQLKVVIIDNIESDALHLKIDKYLNSSDRNWFESSLVHNGIDNFYGRLHGRKNLIGIHSPSGHFSSVLEFPGDRCFG